MLPCHLRFCWGYWHISVSWESFGKNGCAVFLFDVIPGTTFQPLCAGCLILKYNLKMENLFHICCQGETYFKICNIKKLKLTIEEGFDIFQHKTICLACDRLSGNVHFLYFLILSYLLVNTIWCRLKWSWSVTALQSLDPVLL